MTRLILLTKPTGVRVWLNPAHIVFVTPYGNEATHIVLIDDNELFVSESATDIDERINDATVALRALESR